MDNVTKFFKKIQKEIECYQEEVVAAAGRPGVLGMRAKLNKMIRRRSVYRTTYDMFRRDYIDPRHYTPPAPWMHRHGIQTDARMARIDVKCREIMGGERIKFTRGNYGEICAMPDKIVNAYDFPAKMRDLYRKPYRGAEKCIDDVKRHADEHGAWDTGGDFDKHGRGSAINIDVYGIDHEARAYVIQVRQFERRYRNGYGNTRKNYFLIGYNENGNPFAHPVSGHQVHAAIKKDPSPEYVVQAVQAWIWGIPPDKLGEVLRNGDVALIPVKKAPQKNVAHRSGMMRVIDAHWLYSRDIRINGRMYAKNPTLQHKKRQHPTQRGRGWYKVIVGRRAKWHDFATPTAD